MVLGVVLPLLLDPLPGTIPFWVTLKDSQLCICVKKKDLKYGRHHVVQPVNDGLVDDIKDYPGYNCFEDAVTGRSRKYKVVNWKQYNDARRWKPLVSIDDFTELCTLTYTRLPGYEHLSQKAYATLMRKKLAARTKV